MTFDDIKSKSTAVCAPLHDPGNAVIYVSAMEKESVDRIADSFQSALKRQNEKAVVVKAGSCGLYFLEPLAFISINGKAAALFGNLTPEKSEKIVKQYLQGGVPETLSAVSLEEPFWGRQKRLILENCGFVDPESVLSAVDRHGYEAFSKALSSGAESVLDEIQKSRLRGRGGAGFPFFEKISAVRNQCGSSKYIIVNAMQPGEKNPCGLLLKSNPHLVLEGTLIAAFASGAEKGVLCLDATDQQAVSTVRAALEEMRAYHLVGNHILGSDFSFEFSVSPLPGGLHSGEETALLNMLENSRAVSNLRPPYPEEKGLGGNPTLISCAETLANLPRILACGGAAFSSSVSGCSAGTKLVTIEGDAARTLTAEVPFGITLRELVTDVGGVSADERLKTVQVGGITGGFLLPEELDTVYDYEPLEKAGAMVGYGAVSVFNTGHCIVSLMKSCTDQAIWASCGKCVMCRQGNIQIAYILNDVIKGDGKSGDAELLVEIARHMRQYSNCGLGKSAANPVLTGIEKFFDEFGQHILRHKCAAMQCRNMITFYIDGELCKGCGKCLPKCPVHAIDGDKNLIHVIDQKKCDHCGLCLEECPNGAILKASGILPQVPESPMPVGSFKKRRGLMHRRSNDA